MTTTSAPACLANTLIPAPPSRKFRTICGVTSFGNADTPSSATPWSPAKVKIAFLFSTGSRFSMIATTLAANSSNLPRLPCGLVRLSSRFCAFSKKAGLTGLMELTVCSNLDIVRPPYLLGCRMWGVGCRKVFIIYLQHPTSYLLYLHRYPCCYKIYLICCRCYFLICITGNVSELPRQRIVRHDAGADL